MINAARPGTPGLSGAALEDFLRHVHTIHGGGPLTAARRAELLVKLARAGQLADHAEPAAATDAARVGATERATTTRWAAAASPALPYDAPLPGQPYSTKALDGILIYRARRGQSLAAPLDKGTRRVLVWETMDAPLGIETALHTAGW